MVKPVIAVDADGVMLNYHEAYRQVWQRAFGYLPELADPKAYYPIHRWKVPLIEPSARAELKRFQDEEFWSTMPAMAGAIDAAIKLHEAGYELVCVTAVPMEYQGARLRNLQALGYPIERVIAANEGSETGRSIKAAALEVLQPVAFVDDYAPYLRGIPADIHAALVLREPNGSPNTGEDLLLAYSTHADLAGFAQWWLSTREGMAT